MTNMICEQCGVNPATTTVTRVTSKGREVRHICETCAAKYSFGGFDTSRFGPLDFFEESPFFNFPFPFGAQSRAPRQEAINIMDYFTERAKDAVQKAAQTAAELKHTTLDTEHLLMALAEEKDVAAKILQELGINPDDLVSYIKEAVPEGSESVEAVDVSPRSKRVLELAFDEARALSHNYVGSEHILLGLIREGEGLAAQTLKKYAVDLTKARAAVIKLVGRGLKEGEAAKKPSETPVLDKFSRDLTVLAAEGKLDPVIGREEEISRVISVLSRKTKNNPVLIGEPGVGKTAIAEGLATKIVKKEVPELLQGKRLIALDLAGMVAGTKYRGSFEERLKKATEEIQNAKGKVILFIDELHTLVGAGAAEGAIDAGNILKPALGRGELQAIGATTLSDYKKYVEKDPALERRFQQILVPENTVSETIEILKGLRDRYEAHHRVKITDEAIEAAATLSDRYISDRFLPDKTIDIIDEASAEVRLCSIAPPKNLQQVEEQIQKLTKEREAAGRAKKKKRANELEQKIKELEKTKDEIKELWERTKGTKLPIVNQENVAQVLCKMTGIPLAKLTEEEKEKLLSLEGKLHERIVNQDEAVKIVAEAMRRARAGLKDPKRPIGSFVFMGPTGVGKTELTRALAEVLYGSPDLMIRLDMSEYQERHTVARLIGSPPGYIGFEEGGQLTEKVRRKPFSIILLDEVEKAHPDVFNLLLQIMEDGRLTDGKGRTVNFKNTILIMTSNLGGMLILEAQEKGRAEKEVEEELEALVKKTFRPEFINRVDEFVVFKALTQEQVLQVVDLLLENTRRLVNAQNMDLEVSKEVKSYLANEGFDSQFGARPLRRVIQREIENPISEKIIKGEITEGEKIKVELDKKGVLKFAHA